MRRKLITIFDKEKIKDYLNKFRIITNGGHWLYPRVNHYGYGVAQFNKKLYSVGKLSLYLYKDFDIYSNLMALHKTTCPYKNCFNPDCLYPGNSSDNTKDSVKVGTFKNPNKVKTHCIHGHEFTKENIYIQPSRKGRLCRKCREIDQTRRNKEASLKRKQRRELDK